MRRRINTDNRFNTRNRNNTANRVNMLSNMANRFNMLSRFVNTQRIGCGVGSGIVNMPNRFTIHGSITIPTTGTLSGITAVVDTPAADIAAAHIAAVVVEVTPVEVTVAIGNGRTVRMNPRQSFIAC